MNDDEFTNYVNDLSIDDQLSDYELNILLSKANNDERLRDKLKQYEHQTRKSYEVLPEWRNVIKLISFAKMWTRNNVFYYDSEGNGNIFYPQTIISQELNGYNVSDPSQW
ncbi:hypothetical protein LTY56_03015 [Limosilactobacillus albertensis]|nr:hypothetical protein [Limosilactobacillus albertensis]MCD7117588.1 hypothetical protein [Limosilactobacillus albertensis]MCD7128995.1 hypothetical protein [Limosilactobacillus albertensis]